MSVKYTIDIFARLQRDLAPLVPKEVKADMQQAITQMKENYDLTIDELEDTIISFGKKIWPYRKAFEEFLDTHEAAVGEGFLVAGLSREMKQRYRDFKAYGGTLRDLHVGSPATFFSAEERGFLCEALVEMNLNIRRHTTQSVLSVERQKYENKVVEFQIILDDIEKRLDTLRLMAEGEQEHPELAAEIREQIKSFEFGLCLLGPAHQYEAVCNAEEHFVGRKKEKVFSS